MKWGDPLDCVDATAWREWLRAQHDRKSEVFLLIHRDRSRERGLRYEEAVEEALCFGWIDGIARRFDSERSLNRFTPRRPGSNWSDSNRVRIRDLAARGALEQSGRTALSLDLLEEIDAMAEGTLLNAQISSTHPSETSPRRSDAVIFDMDGVLLDSEPLHFEALRSVLATDGFDWSETDNEELLGTTVHDTFVIIGTRRPLTRPIESYLTVYEAAVLEVLSRPLQPSLGVKELLDDLQARRIPLAVASSSRRSWIEATLRSLGIDQYFGVVVSGDEVDRGKPAPDIYLRASEILGVPPERCTAIEDAPNGVLSAHNAGMRVIAVRTPYTRHLTLEGADEVVDSLDQVDLDDIVGTARHSTGTRQAL